MEKLGRLSTVDPLKRIYNTASLILRSGFIVVPHHVNSSAECMTTMNLDLNLWVLYSGVVSRGNETRAATRPSGGSGLMLYRRFCWADAELSPAKSSVTVINQSVTGLRDFKIVYYLYLQSRLY